MNVSYTYMYGLVTAFVPGLGDTLALDATSVMRYVVVTGQFRGSPIAMRTRNMFPRLRGRRGATIVFVALAMVALLSFAALAVDLGYLYVVRNELQNAADAGALAGAQVLYLNDGTAVNPDADDMARDYVGRNFSEKSPVIVESAQRGHWSFSTRTFTANDSEAPVALWDVSTKELDENTNFINAVQVITRRTEVGVTPPQTLLRDGSSARPLPRFGRRPSRTSDSPGRSRPAEADQPIAICKESIRDDAGQYTCGVGRMINSGNGNDGHQTGGWTNFTQPCETANGLPSARSSAPSGNPNMLTLGAGMGTVGGQVQTAADQLRDCWVWCSDIDGTSYRPDSDGWPEQPWSLMLPVIECPDNNVGPCSAGRRGRDCERGLDHPERQEPDERSATEDGRLARPIE